MPTPISRRRCLALTAAITTTLGAAPSVILAQNIPQPSATVDAAALLVPGTLADMFEGDENAPVTMIEYASFTCNHCANFAVNTMPEIREKYIKTGKLRLIFREYAFDPRAAAASMLVRCVPEDRYFPFAQLLFEKQAEWAFVNDARPPLVQFSKLAGLDEEAFNACIARQPLLEGINATLTRARDEFDVTATPTLFINGKKYAGALSANSLSAIIDAELARYRILL